MNFCKKNFTKIMVKNGQNRPIIAIISIILGDSCFQIFIYNIIRQSGYRKHHSTETAVLHITNDILSKKDSHQTTALVSIDLSA